MLSISGSDSVCCHLSVQGMMGSRNGENDCTKEGCKLGKARLRTNRSYGSTGTRRKKLKLIISYQLNSLTHIKLFTLITPSQFSGRRKKPDCLGAESVAYSDTGWRRGSF